MSSLLGHRPATLPEGRAELADAVRTGRVPDADYVRYMWNKVLRDDHLMRNASGALHLRHWPPLV